IVLLACAGLIGIAYGEEALPPGPNPYLSFLPAEAETDWAYWKARARIEGRARRSRLDSLDRAFPFGETEPNDTQATANAIAGF
ncbi:MAG: hypothetical protein GTO30_15610, partial [Acidobacteria bacterium]|nr:hypothetical protein [Acidobacteriota bacterium]NIQ87214.1 hypothetical protein [Acidobacteriota bacterium]